jgi:hypothetical protein
MLYLLVMAQTGVAFHSTGDDAGAPRCAAATVATCSVVNPLISSRSAAMI